MTPSAEDEDDRRSILGNAAADAAATAHARSFLPSEVAMAAVTVMEQVAKADVVAAAQMLASWPQLATEGNAVRLPRQTFRGGLRVAAFQKAPSA